MLKTKLASVNERLSNNITLFLAYNLRLIKAVKSFI
jgi:hypothetical protein